MLGPMRAPRLNAKAKETHGLLPFCLKLLEMYRMKLKADGPDFVKKQISLKLQVLEPLMSHWLISAVLFAYECFLIGLLGRCSLCAGFYLLMRTCLVLPKVPAYLTVDFWGGTSAPEDNHNISNDLMVKISTGHRNMNRT